MRKLSAMTMVVALIGVMLLISVSSVAAWFRDGQKDQLETDPFLFGATPTPAPMPAVMPTATPVAIPSPVPAATPSAPTGPVVTPSAPTSGWTTNSTASDDEYQAQVAEGKRMVIKSRSDGRGATIAILEEGDIVTVLAVTQSGNMEVARVRYNSRIGWVLFSLDGEEYFEPVDD